MTPLAEEDTGGLGFGCGALCLTDVCVCPALKGKQYTRFGCRRRADSKMVHRRYCENIKKPRAISRDCNQKECSQPMYVWMGGLDGCLHREWPHTISLLVPYTVNLSTPKRLKRKGLVIKMSPGLRCMSLSVPPSNSLFYVCLAGRMVRGSRAVRRVVKRGTR